MFIDSHAHLDMSDFDADRQRVLERAQTSGIEHIITVGYDLISSKKALQIAQSIPNVSAAVGIHPHDAKIATEPVCEEIKQLAKESGAVAIGEIGLDYYRNLSPREVQREAFLRQIQIANELKLPIVVHIRDAYPDALQILKDEKASLQGGVIHCFSGDSQDASRFLELGYYISLAGPLTYPKSEMLRKVAKEVPIERLMIETDCPYLPPQPYRGKRNEPAYVLEVAKKLAELKGLSLGDVGRITSLNVFKLFGIGNNPEEGKISYKIRNSTYLNITNKCSNSCSFCVRSTTPFVKGHHLTLARDPSLEEVWQAIGDPSDSDEVVFCGLGEPLMRLDIVKEISRRLKEKSIKVRVNSNGQANLIHGRNILPELAGLIDEISISLNAQDEGTYHRICNPQSGETAYQAIKEFIREAKKFIPQVGVTALNGLPGVDIRLCREIAEKELGVSFRERKYNEVG